MSDLPNFTKKHWLRRIGVIRVLIILAAGLAAVWAWAEEEPSPSDNLSIALELPQPKLMIGQPVTLKFIVKNTGTRTIDVKDLQASIRLTQGACVDASTPARSTFSMPTGGSVEPNSTRIFLSDLQFLPPCDGKASLRTHIKVTSDNRSEFKTLPGPVVDIL